MMDYSLLVQSQLTPTQRGVRDHFVEGGSPVTVLLVVLVCALIVVCVYLLTHRQAIRAGSAPSSKQLFRSAMELGGLSEAQRAMLRTVASSEQLEHPAVLLLSRPMYDHHVDQWLNLKQRPKIDDKLRAQVHLARELRATLFPPR